MSTQPKKPESAEWLSILGIISIIAGALGLVVGFHDNVAYYVIAGGSALMTGAVLLGMSAAITLLAKIASNTTPKETSPPSKPQPKETDVYRI